MGIIKLHGNKDENGYYHLPKNKNKNYIEEIEKGKKPKNRKNKKIWLI